MLIYLISFILMLLNVYTFIGYQNFYKSAIM